MSYLDLFLILIILLSFILFIIFLLLILLLYTNIFLFTHTLIRSLLTTLDSHVQGIGHFLYFQVFVGSSASRGAGASLYLILVFLSSLPFCYFLILDISDSVIIPVSLFIWYHAWMLICDIVVIIDILWFRFIACSGHLGLACMRGVFSSRIYIADSRRDSVFTYFEKRGVTEFMRIYGIL